MSMIGSGKVSGRLGLLLTTALVGVGAVFTGAGAARAQSLPTGGNVVAGAATIDESVANLTTVDLNDTNSIIQWDSYNVLTGNTVSYITADTATQYRVLNRVVLANPSTITGAINSGNGGANNIAVWLINPSGIMFGSGGTFTGGSLVLSTLDVGDGDFLDGAPYTLSGTSTESIDLAAGSVIDANGDIVVTGQRINAAGSMTASGTNRAVALVAATDVTLQLDPGSPLGITVNAGTTLGTAQVNADGSVQGASVILAGTGTAIANLLSVNSGATLTATAGEGGRVILATGSGIDASANGTQAGVSFGATGGDGIASAGTISGPSVIGSSDGDFNASGGSITTNLGAIGAGAFVFAGGNATVAGAVDSAFDYSVTGDTVTLGAAATTVSQLADATVAITATGGGVTGLGTLTLQSNADGLGNDALTISATGGAVDFDAASSLLGGTAQQSAVSVTTANSAVTLGDVSAMAFTLAGLTGANFTAGDITTTDSLSLNTGTGDISLGSATTTGAAADISLTGGAVSATGPLDATGAITANAATTLNLGTASADGALSLTAAGALTVAAVSGGTDATVSSTGGSATATSVSAGTGNASLSGSTGASADSISGGNNASIAGGSGAVTVDTVTATGGNAVVTGDSLAGNTGMRASVSATGAANTAMVTVTGLARIDTIASGAGTSVVAGSFDINSATAGTGADVSLTGTGGGTLGTASGDDITVNTGANAATVTGDITAAGNYTVTGGSVTLGTAATTVSQTAGGFVDIVSTAGAITGLGTLTLQSNSDGAGGGDLVLDATGGAINFDAASTLEAGTAAERTIAGLRLGSAANVTLGDVNAATILDANAGAPPRTFGATLTLSGQAGNLALGDVTTTSALSATIDGDITAGAITVGGTAQGLTLNSVNAGQDITLNGAAMASGAVSLSASDTLTGTTLSGASVSATANTGSASLTSATSTAGDVTLSAGTLLNVDTVSVTGGVAMLSGDDISADTVTASGDVTLSASDDIEVNSLTATAGSISADSIGGDITGRAGLGSRIALTAGTGAANNVSLNANGGTAELGAVIAGNNVTISAGSVDASPSIAATAGALSVTATTGNVQFGTATGGTTALVQATAGSVTGTSLTSGNGDATVMGAANATVTNLSATGGNAALIATTGNATANGAISASGGNASVAAGTTATVNGITASGTMGDITISGAVASLTGAYSATGKIDVTATNGAITGLSGTTLQSNSGGADDSGNTRFVALDATNGGIAFDANSTINAGTAANRSLLGIRLGTAGQSLALGDVNARTIVSATAGPARTFGTDLTAPASVTAGDVRTTDTLDINITGPITVDSVDVSAGALFLRAQGAGNDLTLNGAASSSGQMILNAGDAITGTTLSGASVSATAGGASQLTSATSTAGLVNLVATAGSITVDTVTAQGGSFTSSAGTTFSADTITSDTGSGSIMAGGDVGVNSLSVDQSIAVTSTGGNVTGRAGLGSRLALTAGTANTSNIAVNANSGTAMLGAVTAGNNITVNADVIDATSATATAGTLTVTADNGGLTLGTGMAGGTVSLTATGNIATDSATSIDGNILVSTGGDLTGQAGGASRAALAANGAGRSISVGATSGTANLGAVSAGASVFVNAGAIDASPTITATTGQASLQALTGNLAFGSIAAGTTATAQSDAGSVTGTSLTAGTGAAMVIAATSANLGSLSAGTDVSVTAGTTAAVSGTVMAGGNYSVMGTSVSLGTGAARTQQAAGTVNITATAGSVTATDLILRSNSDDTGADALTVSATGGGISFLGAAGLLEGGTTRSANVSLSTTSAAVFQDVNALALTVTAPAGITGGDIVTTDTLSLTTAAGLNIGSANVTAGNISLDGGLSVGAGALTASGDITVTSDLINVTSANAGGALSLTADNGGLTLGTGSAGTTATLNKTGGAGELEVTTSVTGGTGVTISSNTAARIASATATTGDLTATAATDLTGVSGGRANLSAAAAGGNLTATATAGTALLGTVSAGNDLTVTAGTIDASPTISAANGALSLTATASDITVGSVSGGTNALVASTTGNATVGSITAGNGTATVMAGSGTGDTATVNGASASGTPGDIIISGAVVALAGTHSATGKIDITASDGAITGTSGLSLTSNSGGAADGGDTRFVALDATNGGIAFDANSTINGGTGRESLLGIRVAGTNTSLALGNVNARTIVDATAGPARTFTASLTNPSSVTLGDVSTATALDIQITGPITTGAVDVSAGDLTLAANGAGNDLTVNGAATATGAIGLAAGGDVFVNVSATGGTGVSINAGSDARIASATATTGDLSVTSGAAGEITGLLPSGNAILTASGGDVTVTAGTLARLGTVTTGIGAGNDIVVTGDVVSVTTADAGGALSLTADVGALDLGTGTAGTTATLTKTGAAAGNINVTTSVTGGTGVAITSGAGAVIQNATATTGNVDITTTQFGILSGGLLTALAGDVTLTGPAQIQVNNVTAAGGTGSDVTMMGALISAGAVTASGALDLQATNADLDIVSGSAGTTATLTKTGMAPGRDLVVRTSITGGTGVALSSTTGVRVNDATATTGDLTIVAATELTSAVNGNANLTASAGDITVTSGTLARLGTVTTGAGAGNDITVTADSITAATVTAGGLIDFAADVGALTLGSGSAGTTATLTKTGATGDLAVTGTVTGGTGTTLSSSTNARIANAVATTGNLTVTATAQLTGIGAGNANLSASAGDVTATGGTLARLGTVTSGTGAGDDIVVTADVVSVDSATAGGLIDLAADVGDLALGTGNAGTTATLTKTGASGQLSVNASVTGGTGVTISSTTDARVANATATTGDLTLTATGEATGVGAGNANLTASAGDVTVTGGTLARLGAVTAGGMSGDDLVVRADVISVDTATVAGLIDLETDVGGLTLGTGSAGTTARLVKGGATGDLRITDELVAGGDITIDSATDVLLAGYDSMTPTTGFIRSTGGNIGVTAANSVAGIAVTPAVTDRGFLSIDATGNLSITGSGDIRAGSLSAGGDLTVSTNNGSLTGLAAGSGAIGTNVPGGALFAQGAGGTVTVTAGSAMGNTAQLNTIAADGNISVTANTIILGTVATNTGTLTLNSATGVPSNPADYYVGSLTSTGNLSLILSGMGAAATLISPDATLVPGFGAVTLSGDDIDVDVALAAQIGSATAVNAIAVDGGGVSVASANSGTTLALTATTGGLYLGTGTSGGMATLTKQGGSAATANDEMRVTTGLTSAAGATLDSSTHARLAPITANGGALTVVTGTGAITGLLGATPAGPLDAAYGRAMLTTGGMANALTFNAGTFAQVGAANASGVLRGRTATDLSADTLTGSDVLLKVGGNAGIGSATATATFAADVGGNLIATTLMAGEDAAFRVGGTTDITTITAGDDVDGTGTGAIAIGTATTSGLGADTLRVVFGPGSPAFAAETAALSNVLIDGASDVTLTTGTADDTLALRSGAVLTTGTLIAGEDIALRSTGNTGIGSAQAGDDIELRAGGALTATSLTTTGAGLDTRRANLDGAALGFTAVAADRSNILANVTGAATISTTSAHATFAAMTGGALEVTTLTAGEDASAMSGSTINVGPVNAGDDIDLRATGALTGTIASTSGAGLDTRRVTYGGALPGFGAETAARSNILVDAGGSVDLGLPFIMAPQIQANASLAVRSGGNVSIANATAGEDIAVSSAGDTQLGVARAGDDLIATSAGGIAFTTSGTTTGMGADDRRADLSGVPLGFAAEDRAGADIVLTATGAGGAITAPTLTAGNDIVAVAGTAANSGSINIGTATAQTGLIDLTANGGGLTLGTGTAALTASLVTGATPTPSDIQVTTLLEAAGDVTINSSRDARLNTVRSTGGNITATAARDLTGLAAPSALATGLRLSSLTDSGATAITADTGDIRIGSIANSGGNVGVTATQGSVTGFLIGGPQAGPGANFTASAGNVSATAAARAAIATAQAGGSISATAGQVSIANAMAGSTLGVTANDALSIDVASAAGATVRTTGGVSAAIPLVASGGVFDFAFGATNITASGAGRSIAVTAGKAAQLNNLTAANAVAVDAAAARVAAGTATGGALSILARTGGLYLTTGVSGGDATLTKQGGSLNAADDELRVTTSLTSGGAATIDSSTHARITAATANGGALTVTTVGAITGRIAGTPAGPIDPAYGRAMLTTGGTGNALTFTAGSFAQIGTADASGVIRGRTTTGLYADVLDGTDVLLKVGGDATIGTATASASFGADVGGNLVTTTITAGEDAAFRTGGTTSITSISAGDDIDGSGTGAITIGTATTTGVGPDTLRVVFGPGSPAFAAETAVRSNILVSGGAGVTLTTATADDSIVLRSGGALTATTLTAGEDIATQSGGDTSVGTATAGDDLRLTSAGGIAIATSATAGGMGADDRRADLTATPLGFAAEDRAGADIVLTATGAGGAITAPMLTAGNDIVAATSAGPVTIGTATAQTGLIDLTANGGVLTLGTGTAALTASLTTTGPTSDIEVTTLLEAGGNVTISSSRDARLNTVRSTGGSITATAARDLTGIVAPSALATGLRVSSLTDGGATAITADTGDIRIGSVTNSAGNVGVTATLGSVTGLAVADTPSGPGAVLSAAGSIGATAGGRAAIGTATAGTSISVGAGQVSAGTATAGTTLALTANDALSLDTGTAAGTTLRTTGGPSAAIALTDANSAQDKFTDAFGAANLAANGATRSVSVTAAKAAQLGTVVANANATVTAGAISVPTITATNGALSLTATNGGLYLGTGTAGTTASLTKQDGDANGLADPNRDELRVRGALNSGAGQTINSATDARIANATAATGNIAATVTRDLTGIVAPSAVATGLRVSSLTDGGATAITADTGDVRIGSVTNSGGDVGVTATLGSVTGLAVSDTPAGPGANLTATAGNISATAGSRAALSTAQAGGSISVGAAQISAQTATAGTTLALTANDALSLDTGTAAGTTLRTTAGAALAAPLTAASGQDTLDTGFGAANIAANGAGRSATVNAAQIAQLGTVAANANATVNASAIAAQAVAATNGALSMTAANGGLYLGTGTAGTTATLTKQDGDGNGLTAGEAGRDDLRVRSALTAGGNVTITSATNNRLAGGATGNAVTSTGGSITVTSTAATTGLIGAAGGGSDASVGRGDLIAAAAGQDVTVTSGGLAQLGTVTAGRNVTVQSGTAARNGAVDIVTATAGSGALSLNARSAAAGTAEDGDVILGTGTAGTTATLTNANGTAGDVRVTQGLTAGGNVAITSVGNARLAGDAAARSVTSTGGSIAVTAAGAVTGIAGGATDGSDTAFGRANLIANGAAQDVTVTAGSLIQLGTASAGRGVSLTSGNTTSNGAIDVTNATATSGALLASARATGTTTPAVDGDILLGTGTAGTTLTLSNTDRGGTTGNVTVSQSVTGGGLVTLDAANSAALGSVTSTGGNVLIRANQVALNNNVRSNATNGEVRLVNRLDTGTTQVNDTFLGTGGTEASQFVLSDAEIDRITGSRVVVQTLNSATQTQNVTINGISLATGTGSAQFDVFADRNATVAITGAISADGSVARTVRIGGADLAAPSVLGTDLANRIIITPTDTAGGRINLPNANLELRGNRVVFGLGSFRDEVIGLTPQDVADNFVSNANSSLFDSQSGYAFNAQTYLQANSLTVRYRDFALFQNSAMRGQNGGLVLGDPLSMSTTPPVRLTLFSSGNTPTNAFAFFGTINGFMGRAAGLLPGSVISFAELDGSNIRINLPGSRINGCVLGSPDAGCLTTDTPPPQLNFFDERQLLLLSSAIEQPIDFDPVIGANNESLFVDFGAFTIPDDADDECEPGQQQPCPAPERRN